MSRGTFWRRVCIEKIWSFLKFSGIWAKILEISRNFLARLSQLQSTCPEGHLNKNVFWLWDICRDYFCRVAASALYLCTEMFWGHFFRKKIKIDMYFLEFGRKKVWFSVENFQQDFRNSSQLVQRKIWRKKLIFVKLCFSNMFSDSRRKVYGYLPKIFFRIAAPTLYLCIGLIWRSFWKIYNFIDVLWNLRAKSLVFSQKFSGSVVASAVYLSSGTCW